MQARANRQKQKADPPKFHDRAEDDLELWLFHIEEHFAAYTVEMSRNDSRFVDMFVPFLGVDVMAWYREFKHAMGSSPRTWPLLKQQIRSRYRDNDYEFKILTKTHDLRVPTTQQEYTTKFTQLLSMSDISMPEIVKRWFYQQHMPTNALKQNRFQQGKRKGNEAGGSNTQPSTKPIPIILLSQLAFNCGVKGHKASGCPNWCAKKLGCSVGWRPTEEDAAAVDHAAVPRQATGDQPSVDYENADALLMLQNSSPHGHLQRSGLVENQPMSAFIDSGASFNAVCPQFAARVGLKVFAHARPLTIRLDVGKQAVIPRRVTSLSIILPDYSIYTTGAFVIEISESCEVMLGMPWLEDINPIIDWTAKTVRPRPDVQPAVRKMDASIEVSDSTPVHRKQFPFSKEQREAILQWTREMLKAKLLRPSSSPYCAPTFCVRKANGEWRIVHDFRGLNAKVRVPANPIPRKDEILCAMTRGKLFSALNLRWASSRSSCRETQFPIRHSQHQTGFTNIW
ncbi:unnamed protein product [Phytophthora fragariaefolia]|uniref:Unnamed protein product n=1 Tax=Phytophthora fragariaefolia TaxID=1490495 RepID=A0A9W6XWN9_9STRA|nr:unnamed protein product [Phytophthora fragariaefolia]